MVIVKEAFRVLLTVTFTMNVPAIPLAVSVDAVARPLVFVSMGADEANEPLAPFVPAVTVNVTLTPLTGLPAVSLTRICKAVGKAVLIFVL